MTWAFVATAAGIAMLHVMNIGNEPPACWSACRARRRAVASDCTGKPVEAAAPSLVGAPPSPAVSQ